MTNIYFLLLISLLNQKHRGYKNIGKDRRVQQILLISITDNVWQTVKRICMLSSKFIGLKGAKYVMVASSFLGQNRAEIELLKEKVKLGQLVVICQQQQQLT